MIFGTINNTNTMTQTPNTLSYLHLQIQDYVEPKHITIAAKMDVIFKTVNDYYGLTTEKIKEKNRSRLLVKCRQTGMYFMRKVKGATLMGIAKMYECDHTTVIYSVEKADTLMENEPDYASEITSLEDLIRIALKK